MTLKRPIAKKTTMVTGEATNTSTANDNKMDDFMELFTSTLKSLAADAECLREISSLAELTGVVPSGYSTTSLTWRDQLYQNSNSDNDASDQLHYKERLLQVDQLVSNLEQKVIALREMIREENAALQKFETTLQEEADAQNDMIQEIMELMEQALHDQQQPEIVEVEEQEFEVTYQQPHRHTLKPRNSSTGSGLLNRSRKNSFDSTSPTAVRKSGGGRFSSSDRQHHPQDESPSKQSINSHHSASFTPITDSEIQEHKRNVPFGLRISRFDLNDALEEIQKVVSRKMAMEEKAARAAPEEQQRRMSANSLQRRFDYLRQRQRKSNGADEIETDAHAGHWWVTEQELRENCAFFRHGESSARGILGMLCSLKRLKQVPGKHMEITYLWL